MKPRTMFAAVVAFGALAGCTAAPQPSSAAVEPTSAVDPAKVECGLRVATMADGTCFPVGPADPAPEASSAFARSVDGWGITATHGEHCGAGELALLGEPACVPVDDCSAAFPPDEAEVVVSTKTTGPRVVSTLGAALARVSRGGIIAIDSGKYLSTNISADVTLIGRCARDTIVGDGKHNALYAHGAHVLVRSVTLVSAASPIAVADGGIVDAENVILKGAHVAIGASTSAAKVTLKHSLIEGLGAEESLGALAAQGGTVTISDSEIRNVTAGALATDPNSNVSLRRVVVDLVGGGAKSTGIAASARGHVDVEESLIRSQGVRLVALHDDRGTLGGSTVTTGTMAIRSSVLEQIGVELTDAPAIDVEGEAAFLELTDVTLRHQALEGILVAGGSLKMNRVAFLGEEATVKLRSAVAALKGATVDAEAIAIPWAQGAGITVGDGADLDLRKSLIAHVIARGPSQEGLLVATASASLSDCELANNERSGIVSIGQSTIAARRTFIHGSHAPKSSSDKRGVFGVLGIHLTGTFEDCVFEDNDEAIAAAASQIVVQRTAFRKHRVALRAMDGMTFAEDTTELTRKAIAVSECTFADNEQRTSTETLPELNAPIGEQPGGSD